MTETPQTPEAKSRDHQSFYMRFHDPAVYQSVVDTAARTSQPMREVVELACKFALASQYFSVPTRETTADKLTAARERKLERMKAKGEP